MIAHVHRFTGGNVVWSHGADDFTAVIGEDAVDGILKAFLVGHKLNG